MTQTVFSGLDSLDIVTDLREFHISPYMMSDSDDRTMYLYGLSKRGVTVEINIPYDATLLDMVISPMIETTHTRYTPDQLGISNVPRFEGLCVGGCFNWKLGYSVALQYGHAHSFHHRDFDPNTSLGWICINTHDNAFLPDGSLSSLFYHELAHLVVDTRDEWLEIPGHALWDATHPKEFQNIVSDFGYAWDARRCKRKIAGKPPTLLDKAFNNHIGEGNWGIRQEKVLRKYRQI